MTNNNGNQPTPKLTKISPEDIVSNDGLEKSSSAIVKKSDFDQPLALSQ